MRGRVPDHDENTVWLDTATDLVLNSRRPGVSESERETIRGNGCGMNQFNQT